MSKTLITFDYSGLDKPKLLYYSGQFAKALDRHTASGFEIGKIIAEAHALFDGSGKSGVFARWVECELKIGRQTAYNYMWTWQRFGNCPSLGQFTQEALYALASPKTPEQAVKEAIKLSGKGETIDKKKATELIGNHKHASNGRRSNAAAAAAPAAPPPPANGSAPKGGQGEAAAPYVDPVEAACDHEWDDEACTKCHAPKPPKISGGVTFNTEEFEGESKDAFGDDVPEELAKAFELREEFAEQRQKITGIKTWITQRLNHPGAAVLESAVQRVRTDLDQADAELKFCTPYCVCIYCENKNPKVANCNACKGLGWITEPIYKAAPKGMKREKVRK